MRSIVEINLKQSKLLSGWEVDVQVGEVGMGVVRSLVWQESDGWV